MKILIGISRTYSGGAEKQAITDANYLTNLGHDITFFYREAGIFHPLLDSRIKQYHFRTQNRFAQFLEMVWHLLTHRYDVVHGHMLWAMRTAILAAWLTRTKSVGNEHGLGVWSVSYKKFMMKIVGMLSGRIICTCEEIRQMLIKCNGIRPEKLITIYTAYDEKPDVSDKHLDEVKTNGFTIGFVGRIQRVKRVHLFFDIAEKLRSMSEDFHIYVVGTGKLLESMRTACQEKGLEKHITFTGFVEDIVPYLKAFNAFVLPSETEGLSLAFDGCDVLRHTMRNLRCGWETARSSRMERPDLPSRTTGST